MLKNLFSSKTYKYLAIYGVKVFQIFSTHSYTSLVQNHVIKFEEKKTICKVFFYLCNRNGTFEWLLMKKDLGTVGINLWSNVAVIL